ncbi:MAG: hypothetical protein EBT57_02415, partial [Verrucomicrobia bacterium]|nr:hypothetical protein [Verrucomicrobiota bacterium]
MFRWRFPILGGVFPAVRWRLRQLNPNCWGCASRRKCNVGKAGKVWIVGAGPGDPGLITVRGRQVLRRADVILFDDLVSDDVLELARREAKRMMVGKRARGPSCSQADINALMLKLAQQGKNVVRLKSGDPMVFGRAG